MKRILFVSILCILFAASCKKSIDAQTIDREEAAWSVSAVGQDTITSPTVWAREQTTALATDEDSQLKAELIGYLPQPGGKAKYIIRMTNKTSCRMIQRWNWNELALTSIEPNDATAGTPQADIIDANEVKIYTAIGKATVGTIFVKSEKHNSTCPNSSQLKLEITMAILPIKFISTTAKFNDKTKNVTVLFTIDDPTVIDYFILWKLVDKQWVYTKDVKCDKKTKDWSILIWDGPLLK